MSMCSPRPTPVIPDVLLADSLGTKAQDTDAAAGQKVDMSADARANRRHQSDFQERRKAEGWKNVRVLLSPDENALLDELAAGRLSRVTVMRRALAALAENPELMKGGGS